MTKQDIITAISAGLTVHWKSIFYTIKVIRGDYYLKASNGNLIGIVGDDGSWNIDPDDCFIHS